MSMGQWGSLVKKKEKVYIIKVYKFTLEAAQLSCVRNDFERLRLVVEQHEQRAQADPSLITPTRGVSVRDNI